MTPPGRSIVAFWLGLTTALAALFWHADRKGFPFCGVVRYIFGCHKRTGRIVLVSVVEAGAIILLRHLFRPFRIDLTNLTEDA